MSDTQNMDVTVLLDSDIAPSTIGMKCVELEHLINILRFQHGANGLKLTGHLQLIKEDDDD